MVADADADVDVSVPLTAGDPPAGDPAVVSRAEAGLLARQAGVADEVGRVDVRRCFDQRDVVVQLAVGGVAEALVPVDPLHRENPLHRLGTLQLVLPQDDPPAPSILCFPSGSPKHGSVRRSCGSCFGFPVKPFEFLCWGGSWAGVLTFGSSGQQ